MNNDASELVDVVDPNNQVIGQITKNQAHQQGLLHRTVISEIINPKGQWLLVKQAGDRQDPGQYVSPVGGHVKAGESELEALAREADEEAGITDINNPTRVGQAIFNRFVNGHQENHYFIVYQIHVPPEYVPVLNHESESCSWFSVDEIKSQLITHPQLFGDAFRFVWNDIFNYGSANPKQTG
jgi:isopentenyl-diphosphate Delta-isomerase